MTTLLTTSKYRKTFGLPERLMPAASDEGALGPWYANTLNVGSARMLHFMSGPSLLSVFIPLRERSTAEERFVRALAQLLRDLGVEGAYIEREVNVIVSGFQYGRASDRSRLGFMRALASYAKYDIAERDFTLPN